MNEKSVRSLILRECKVKWSRRSWSWLLAWFLTKPGTNLRHRMHAVSWPR